MIKRFKHSGTLGDIIYSLPLVKHLGGGEFYLHLNQINWVGQHYYGYPPAAFHQNSMTEQQFQFMHSFMRAQSYITDFATLTAQQEITHNLDRFRHSFVHHPGNYVDCYADCWGITDADTLAQMRNCAWLTVPSTVDLGTRRTVINRSARWQNPRSLSTWQQWRHQLEHTSVFVGLGEEHTAFCEFTGWSIPHWPTDTMLQLAQVIGSADQFIGNQSVSLSLAVGLGVDWQCEARDDLPLSRNECYFPQHPRGNYF
jgi:hypothetical protein